MKKSLMKSFQKQWLVAVLLAFVLLPFIHLLSHEQGDYLTGYEVECQLCSHLQLPALPSEKLVGLLLLPMFIILALFIKESARLTPFYFYSVRAPPVN